MPIVTTDTQTLANEPVTLAEAKTQLRITHDLDDTEITRLILAAREEAERFTLRTLRLSVSHEETYSAWPDCIRFDSPPLIAVSAVTYYDADNAEQTLASSNYIVQTPTDDRGQLSWTWDAVLPDHYDRVDAIKVAYTSGYTTADEVPESAKQGILLLVEANFDADKVQKAEAYRVTAQKILNQLDWGSYE